MFSELHPADRGVENEYKIFSLSGYFEPLYHLASLPPPPPNHHLVASCSRCIVLASWPDCSEVTCSIPHRDRSLSIDTGSQEDPSLKWYHDISGT